MVAVVVEQDTFLASDYRVVVYEAETRIGHDDSIIVVR
jgi:hypothetical protein